MPKSSFKKFVPFAKVDAQKREVYGIVTAEMPDKTGETCHYDSTKAEYQAWSNEFSKATEGKSLGNLREMHTLSAVGKAISLEFNDPEKEIFMGFKVVDEEAWRKVDEGVYTGFSHGGNYAKQWRGENGRRYYTAKPNEVSLVDNPCLGVAHFAYIKADGSVEMRKVRSIDPDDPEALEAAGSDALPTVAGTVAETATVVPPTQEPTMTPDQVNDIVTKAIAEYVAKTTPPAPPPPPSELELLYQEALTKVNAANESLSKGMFDVAQLAMLLQELSFIQRNSTEEAKREGDASDVPDQLLASIDQLCTALINMTAEESKELRGPDKPLTQPAQDFLLAAPTQVKKTLALLGEATQALQTKADKESIPPTNQGEETPSMEKADHVSKLKKMIEDHHSEQLSQLDKCMGVTTKSEPGTELGGGTATPDIDSIVEKAVSAALAKAAGDQLVPPAAAQNAQGRTVSKAADNTTTTTADGDDTTYGEPVFRPQGASYDASPEFVKALKSVRGVPLNG